jgi:hypothetical protein
MTAMTERDQLPDVPPLDEGPLRGLYWQLEAKRLRAENKTLEAALCTVLERATYGYQDLSAGGVLSTLKQVAREALGDE